MINCLFNPWLLALLVIIVCICSQVCWGKRPARWRNVSTIRQKWELSVVAFFCYKILNTTQSPYLYDLVSSQPPRGHNTRSSPYVTPIKPSSSLKVTHRSFGPSDMLHLIVGTSSLITQNSSSELFIPLSATIIW